MALPVPNLDDRRFQELVNESKRLVSRAAPSGRTTTSTTRA